ncbi:hypothetical protein HAX54_045134 [Datura stramonium]|uniref:Uncharacterized protein n=1 Tax=Datura stramonium TaxID=4076 RepID=A0ABS8WHG1_DATST|nr:hypothetical protein [Datura stramonium]
MAAVAIGGVVLHSSFLGNKLKLPLSLNIPFKKQSNSRIIYAHGGEMLSSFMHDLFVGVGVGLPCTVMECGDIIYRSTLPKSNAITVTVPGVILALGTLSYLWATPGVAPGFFDMFVLAFVERLFRSTYKKDDIVLGKKLGEGSFGAVYRVSLARKLSSKGGDLVLKRATEYGAVEIWMNERVRRACANSCADFLYGFLESSSKKGAEYWLLWRFEGEATLADLMQSREFPYNVGATGFCSPSTIAKSANVLLQQLSMARACTNKSKIVTLADEISDSEGLRSLNGTPATRPLHFSNAETSTQPTPVEKTDFHANRTTQKGEILSYIPPTMKQGFVIGDTPHMKSMDSFVSNTWDFAAKPQTLAHRSGVIDPAISFSAAPTVVYARNKAQNRVCLWEDLKQIGTINTEPWLLCWDFNTMLSSDDRMGSPVTEVETATFI